MLDDAALRRLAEIGIDAYVPRSARRRGGDVTAAAPEASDGVKPRVLVLAQARTKAAERFIADVARAFAPARIACSVAGIANESALAGASALVILGDDLVRAAGAALPGARRDAIGWVAAADSAAVVGDAAAKRALWSEIRRVLRGLRAHR